MPTITTVGRIMFLGRPRTPWGYFIRFVIKDELIRFRWSNIKGPCDLTKHINGHYSIINVVITTKLYTNVDLSIRNVKGQPHSDIIMFCKKKKREKLKCSGCFSSPWLRSRNLTGAWRQQHVSVRRLLLLIDWLIHQLVSKSSLTSWVDI